jgi:hypothetical protein
VITTNIDFRFEERADTGRGFADDQVTTPKKYPTKIGAYGSRDSARVYEPRVELSEKKLLLFFSNFSNIFIVRKILVIFWYYVFITSTI